MLAVLISACLLLPSTAGQLDAYVKGSSDVAPDFTLTDIDGIVFSLSDYRGKVVLLDFCGTLCAPCVQEISHLKGLYEEFGEKLVIISTSPEDEEVLSDFRDEYGIGWTVARDTANVFDAYGINAIPTLVTIDQEGYIRYIHVGLTEESILRSEIESLLPKTIYVDDDNTTGPWEGTQEHPYQNITSGLEHASEGDTIYVYNGTYFENVVVNKSVSLIGENVDTTIVGSPSGTTVFRVESNNVHISEFTMQNANTGIFSNAQNVTINSNLITNSESQGIQLSGVSNTVSNNLITNCGTAILIYGSNHIIEQNVIMNNKWFSIQLSYFSSNNRVKANVVADNDDTGIYVQSSDNNAISANEIIDNGKGIRIAYSTGNAIFQNNIINNTRQVYIDRGNINNTWDDGYPSGGNYWSDYEERYPDAEEIDDSGIWDTPYVIDDYNQDNYPLMEPYSPLPTTIGELKTEIEELGLEGEIDNKGIVKSLIAKLNVAEKLVDKGKIEEAKTILKKAFVMEVQKLTDIHITPEAADILIESAEYIISHL